MNLPQQTTDESHNLLAALLVMLDGMATPGSPPIDQGGLSIGFYLFMLEHANVTHAEAEGLVKRFRALVAKLSQQDCAELEKFGDFLRDVAKGTRQVDAYREHYGETVYEAPRIEESTP